MARRKATPSDRLLDLQTGAAKLAELCRHCNDPRGQAMALLVGELAAVTWELAHQTSKAKEKTCLPSVCS